MHPGFETQGRCHQKSKNRGYQWPHKNDWCPPKKLNFVSSAAPGCFLDDLPQRRRQSWRTRRASRRDRRYRTLCRRVLCGTGRLDIWTPRHPAMVQLVRLNSQCMLITVRKRSCGKVMFLHLSVSYSVHSGGGSAPVHAGQTTHTTHHWADTPHSRRLLLRTVRILLECILDFK